MACAGDRPLPPPLPHPAAPLLSLDSGFNYGGVLETASDVARGMLHLHMNGILHSDLKAANVMFKSGGSDGRGVIAKVCVLYLAQAQAHACVGPARTLRSPPASRVCVCGGDVCACHVWIMLPMYMAKATHCMLPVSWL